MFNLSIVLSKTASGKPFQSELISKGQFLQLIIICSERDELKCKADEVKSRFYERSLSVNVKAYNNALT